MDRDADGNRYIDLKAVEPLLPREGWSRAEALSLPTCSSPSSCTLIVTPTPAYQRLRRFDPAGGGNRIYIATIVAAAMRLFRLRTLQKWAVLIVIAWCSALFGVIFYAGRLSAATGVVGTIWTAGAGEIVKTADAVEAVSLALLPLVPERSKALKTPKPQNPT